MALLHLLLGLLVDSGLFYLATVLFFFPASVQRRMILSIERKAASTVKARGGWIRSFEDDYIRSAEYVGRIRMSGAIAYIMAIMLLLGILSSHW